MSERGRWTGDDVEELPVDAAATGSSFLSFYHMNFSDSWVSFGWMGWARERGLHNLALALGVLFSFCLEMKRQGGDRACFHFFRINGFSS